MGDVIDLFSGQQVPAANDDESGFVHEFIDNYLLELLGAIDELHRAEDEEEFRRWLREVKYQVDRWPI